MGESEWGRETVTVVSIVLQKKMRVERGGGEGGEDEK